MGTWLSLVATWAQSVEWEQICGAFILIAIAFSVIRIVAPSESQLRSHAQSASGEDREWLSDLLGAAPAHRRYRLAKEAFHVRLNGFWGSRWTNQVLARCLQIIIFYPIALFLLFLLIKGPISPGAI